MKTRRIGASIAAIALTLTMTACSSSDNGEVVKNGTATSTAVATTPAAEVTTEAATNPKFGDSYAWDDGLKVTVSAPSEVTPTEYAAGTVEGWTNLGWTITIENGTSENYDPTMILVKVAAGGQEGSTIFDTDWQGTPTSTILPGNSVTWVAAYAVADPATVQLSIEDVAAFDKGEVIFTN